METLERSNLRQPKYGKLPPAEREALLLSLPGFDHRFTFTRFERFERFGMATDTAVYLHDGAEFVFVPGGTVTLGWEDFSIGMDEFSRNEIVEMLAECDGPAWDVFLRESMSPVRSATVAPMLVERSLHDIGWRDVPVNSPELSLFQMDIQKHFHGTGSFEISHEMRIFQDKTGEIRAQIYAPVSLEGFLERLHNQGFALPTEDEWEYLCGGGSRTLYRWGDSFDHEMKLYWYEEDFPKDMPYSLELPNSFGLSIAYDPYKQEVVENSEYFLKGGDGGCNVCGGMGIVLGYLPVATYFRSSSLANSPECQEDIGGDYTFYRRVVRL